MKQLLVIANTPSQNCILCRDAVINGAGSAELETIDVVCKTPIEAIAADVLNCDAIIIGTTENFGYMSGLIKDFFERIYYPCLEKTESLPFALYVKAGLDGQGAKTSVNKIITGLRWKSVQPALILKGNFDPVFLEQCNELGLTMAAGLDVGIF